LLRLNESKILASRTSIKGTEAQCQTTDQVLTCTLGNLLWGGYPIYHFAKVFNARRHRQAIKIIVMVKYFIDNVSTFKIRS